MTNAIYISFGNRVRDLRVLAKLSQEELAFRCNLHKNYISDVENGRRNVSLKAIYQIAFGLNVPVECLFLK